MVPLGRPKALTNAQGAEGNIGSTDFFTIVEHPPHFFFDEVGDLRGIQAVYHVFHTTIIVESPEYGNLIKTLIESIS